MGNSCDQIREYQLEDLLYLLDNIPYAVWIKDSDGIYKYVNKYYAQITNMVPEDIIGKNDYEFRDKNLAELFLSEDKEILSNEKTVFNRKTPVNMEFKNYFEVSRSVINAREKVKLIGGIGRDITINESLYKEIEDSTLILLNDSESHRKSELPFILKNTLNAAEITIFIFDKKSKKMNIFLKTHDDNTIPKDFSFHITNEDEEKCMEAYKNNTCMETENIKEYIRTYFIQFENELIGILNVHYDNKNSYSNIQEDIIRNTCDRIGIIIKNRILTNKYKQELQKRRETEKKLQTFLDNSIDFYIIFDSENLYFENKSNKERLEDFFGYNMEETKTRLRN